MHIFSFLLYLRLFILMGMHVIISCLLYELELGAVASGILNISESLEGVWTFALLVIKRSVLRSIKQRCFSFVQFLTKFQIDHEQTYRIFIYLGGIFYEHLLETIQILSRTDPHPILTPIRCCNRRYTPNALSLIHI